MVVKPDTVVDPGAVVVHSADASAARGAVVTLGRLHSLTLAAVLGEYAVKGLHVASCDFNRGLLQIWTSAHAFDPRNYVFHIFDDLVRLTLKLLFFYILNV